MNLSIAQIEAELSRRERLPSSPATFAQMTSDGRWRSAKHLRLLDQNLVALAERRIKRLIVTMPPRHGKSLLCSQYFPAWYLGRFPDNNVILASYGASFAAEWGAKARDTVKEYGGIFGVSCREDSQARDRWLIEGHDGGMITAGAGGSITGRGAHLLIVDDPIKNAVEAASESHRRKIWEWWQSVAYTRLAPNGVIVLIQTRWHEDDLAGRLIAESEKSDDPQEKWTVLNLPAVAEHGDILGREEGEALWPEQWSLSKLQTIRKSVGSIVWNALYQQRPAPAEGNYFKREWFKIVEVDRVPRIVDSVRCWDLAATVVGEKGNTDPDYLSGCRMGRGVDGVYYIFGIARDRVSAKVVRDRIVNTARTDGRLTRVRIEQEGAASGKIVAYDFMRALDGFDARFVPVIRASKFTRSGPLNAAFERGDVCLVAGPWNADFIEEAITFPNGRHDDQVDSAVGAYLALSDDINDFSQADLDLVLDGPAIDLENQPVAMEYE